MSGLAATPGANVLRTLEGLRALGRPVGLAELAQQLLALDTPVSPAIARRVVAAALGFPEKALSDPLEPGLLRSGEEARVESVPLERADLHVVDLETTGLSTDDCSIIEIGAVRISGLECVDSFETLVKPRELLPRRITDITGIDDAMLADAPSAAAALPVFRDWLERHPGAPFVAHNASFDSRFVECAFETLGVVPYRTPVLCTVRLARRLIPHLGRFNLDHVCAHFGIRNRARHRAMGDASATAMALIEMLQIALASGKTRTLGDLLDLQARPTRRRPR